MRSLIEFLTIFCRKMKIVILVFIFGCVSVTSFKPIYKASLAPGGKFDLQWQVDYVDDSVTFQINAQLKRSEWMFLGFSDHGEPEKADLIVFYRDLAGRLRMMDTYTDSRGILHVDVKQNYRLISQNFGQRLVVKFIRRINTCDKHDYQFDNGTTHILSLIDVGIPLPGVTNVTRLQPGVQWAQVLKPTRHHQPPLPPDTYTVDMRLDDVSISDAETTYWCHVVQLPLMNRRQHVIRFDGVVQRGHEHLVHHMELFHCEVPPSAKVPLYSGPCSDEGYDQSDNKELEILKSCKRVIAAWAMGAQPVVYPQEAGIPVGGPNFSRYVMIQVHFNNVGKEKGIVDNSGIRFYITPTPRPYDAGILEVGLEYTPKMAIPPKMAAFAINGSCISECTRVGFPPSGIHIFASQLHTHLTGRAVYIRHIRNGRELYELNRDDHFTQMYQEIRTLPQPRHVLPGDALEVVCVYETMDRENITMGGFAITDEMCVSYLHYYPKSNLEVCKSSIENDALDHFFKYMHDYDLDATSASNGVENNYNSIRWTPMTSQLLYDTYSQSGLSMQCNRSSGERFPGLWENMPRPEILEPLSLPKDNYC